MRPSRPKGTPSGRTRPAVCGETSCSFVFDPDPVVERATESLASYLTLEFCSCEMKGRDFSARRKAAGCHHGTFPVIGSIPKAEKKRPADKQILATGHYLGSACPFWFAMFMPRSTSLAKKNLLSAGTIMICSLSESR